MGAWGHGSFDNDAAGDWLHDLCDGDPSLLIDALTVMADADVDAYLDSDVCCAALAAAELVAAALGKGEDRLDAQARTWLTEHHAAIDVDIGVARGAVERVFRASELRDLWDENGADVEWHEDVRELLRRLGA